MVFVILHAACGMLPYFGVFVCCMLYAQDGFAETVLLRGCCRDGVAEMVLPHWDDLYVREHHGSIK